MAQPVTVEKTLLTLLLGKGDGLIFIAVRER